MTENTQEIAVTMEGDSKKAQYIAPQFVAKGLSSAILQSKMSQSNFEQEGGGNNGNNDS